MIRRFIKMGIIGRGGASYQPWWLAGGIVESNCVAAYQAIGAASYAASKINLNNPGTHDLTNGTAFPTWTEAGWAFNGSSQFLVSDIAETTFDQTMIVRISNTTYGANRCLIGNYWNLNNNGTMFPAYNAGLRAYRGAWSGVLSEEVTSGVLALSEFAVYLNGVLDKTGGTNAKINTGGPYYIGKSSYTAWGYWMGTVEAIAIYEPKLTEVQIVEVTQRMAVLPL